MSVSLDRISSPTPSGLTAYEKQFHERQPERGSCPRTEYLPARMGLAVGLTIGLWGGGGGLIVAALAPLADRAGLGAVLYLIAVLMLFAAATAASLPRPVASPPETLRSLRAEVQP